MFNSYFMNNQEEVNSITNRASKLFKNTCVKFNELLKNSNEKITDNLIIYWDSSGNNNLNLFSDKNIIQNIHAKNHCYLSNKKICSNLVKNLKLNQYYPKTYNNLSEINDIQDDNLYFIKNIYSTAGKGVKCVSGKELLNNKINKNEIIQEGIVNLKLIDNKKFVIRAYIIIFNNKIYLSKYMLSVVHGEKYIKTNTSYDIQINHNGYANKESKPYLINIEETEYSEYISKIRDALSNMKELFNPLIENSNKKFIIIGPDILINDKDEIKFIEFNTVPNLVHTKYINDNVNEEMLLDLFYLVFLNKQNDTLFLIE